MIYYVSGVPYSDELYHHGILGQRWYVRRFQNPDGTLTAEGRARYGRSSLDSSDTGYLGAKVKGAASDSLRNVGRSIGKAAKKVGEHELDKFKSRHTWMMSDSELAEKTDRIRRENALREVIRTNKKPIGRVKQTAQDILESGAKTIGTKAFSTLADHMFNKEEAVRTLEEVLSDKSSTAKQIRDATDRFKSELDLKKAQATDRMNKFKPDSDILNNVNKMSKEELDDYNAWLRSRNGTDKAKSEVSKEFEKREKEQKAKEREDNARAEKSKENSEAANRRINEGSQREIDEIVERRRAREESERKAAEEFIEQFNYRSLPSGNDRLFLTSSENEVKKWIRDSGIGEVDFITDQYGNIYPLIDYT